MRNKSCEPHLKTPRPGLTSPTLDVKIFSIYKCDMWMDSRARGRKWERYYPLQVYANILECVFLNWVSVVFFSYSKRSKRKNFKNYLFFPNYTKILNIHKSKENKRNSQAPAFCWFYFYSSLPVNFVFHIIKITDVCSLHWFLNPCLPFCITAGSSEGGIVLNMSLWSTMLRHILLVTQDFSKNFSK